MCTTKFVVTGITSVIAAFAICLASPAAELDFKLSALTTDANKMDMGAFKAGEVLTVSFCGQVHLLDDWPVYADGVPVKSINHRGYGYVNSEASNYPKGFGGDGKNHFPGGGLNYDSHLGGSQAFGIAGRVTTDTTDAGAIRLGSVVGTFKANPKRGDWFYIGTSKTIVIPSDGTHLYLAVNDSTYPNNSGSFNGRLTVHEGEGAVANQSPAGAPDPAPLYPAASGSGGSGSSSSSGGESTIEKPSVPSIRTSGEIEIRGEVGQNIRIDYATSLPPDKWTTLTNITLPSSLYLFRDTTKPANGPRYYRTVRTP